GHTALAVRRIATTSPSPVPASTQQASRNPAARDQAAHHDASIIESDPSRRRHAARARAALLSSIETLRQLEQPLAIDRHDRQERRDDRGPREHADEPEQLQSAEDPEEQKRRRQVRLPADDERLHEVVDRRDDEA